MIVPMKRATILFQEKDAEATVAHLRRLGVMHVEHQVLPGGRDINTITDQVALIDAALDVMNRLAGAGRPPQQGMEGDWTAVARQIIGQGKRWDQLESLSRELLGRIAEWEQWGEIDRDQVRDLEQHQVYLRLYLAPAKEIQDLPGDVVVQILFTSGDISHVAVISRHPFSPGWKEVVPPDESLSRLRTRLAEGQQSLDRIRDEVKDSAQYFQAFGEIRKGLEKEREFRMVLSGMGREGAIGFVTGYLPVDCQEQLVSESRKRGWGVHVTEPSPDDPVPTLLRNPRWVELINPVLSLLGLTPGYRELDVSLIFLVFFSIFFGILIGDAGYGLVYVLISVLVFFWLKKKGMLNLETETMVVLFCLLGSCTIVWGLLTGTFFGQGWLRPIVPQLNEAGIMTTFCFFLGALHLSLAHAWRALLKIPSLTALADLGYISILWAAFFLARTLILGEVFPPAGLWLAGAGVSLVVIFTSPRRSNPIRGIAEGLGTIALSFMNNITDVISYIRLFAVSMAGLAVAETTNYLASGFGAGPVAAIAGAVILLSGHSLNLILGLMSVLVHGVRLNVLEFSGHANVTWNGSPYDPLRE